MLQVLQQEFQPMPPPVLKVVQQEVSSLSGTNGLMMRTILDNATYYTLSPSFEENSGPMWKQLLDMTYSKKCSALIDCGALTVGVNNRDIAAHLT